MVKKLTAMAMSLALMLCAQALAVCVVQAEHTAVLATEDGDRLTAANSIFELIDDALYAVGSAGDYALCDARGNPIDAARYEMLEAARDVILYRQDGRYGAMDHTGAVLVLPEWDALTYAGEGTFLALEGDIYDDQPNEMICLGPNGERLNTGSMTQNGLRAFHDGRMAFMMSDGHYGYVDAQGRQVIPPQWLWAGDFANGMAIVSDADGMGLIDVEGRIVIPPKYAWMQRSAGRIAALSGTGGLDVWSADGAELAFALEGVSEAEVCGDYLIAKNDGNKRIYDANGVCVFESSPETLFWPGLDGQLIAMDGAWGDTCQYLLNPDGSAGSGRYQRLVPLRSGRYTAMRFETDNYDDVRYGLLAADGTELLPTEYREISCAGRDRLALVTDDAVIFADLDGNALQQWPISETTASSFEASA